MDTHRRIWALVSIVALFLPPTAINSQTTPWYRVNVKLTDQHLINQENYRVISGSFTSENNGWIVGSKRGNSHLTLTTSIQAHTKDGGLSWAATDLLNLALDDVFFVDDMNGWIVGTRNMTGPNPSATAVVLRTKDGGKHWDEHLPLDRTRSYLVSAFFSNVRRGFAAGGMVVNKTMHPVILHTSDGGATWDIAHTGLDRGGVAIGGSIAFDHSGRFGIVSGNEDGRVLVTRDGGSTWKSVQTGYTSILLGAAVVGGSEAWVTTDAGILLHTTDEGVSWSQKEIKGFDSRTTQLLEDVRLSFMGIVFENKETGWISGNRGLILRTRNGGLSWELEASYESAYFRRLLRVQQTILAIGDDLTLLVRKL